MGGLFDTFSVAKRGLSVAQSQINTTSHNIANTNTTGYTRQRSVASTTTPYGGNSKFDSCSVGQVGTGAEITSIERIRDSFIDYQVRTQQTKTSSLDTQDEYLEKLNDILDETSDDTGLQSSLDDLYDAFQTLTKADSLTTANKTNAISAASALATAIKGRYEDIEDIKTSVQTELADTNVSDINTLLDDIKALNKQIADISSDTETPNDLMDTRDNKLDELSKYFGISIETEDANAIVLSANDMSSTASPLVSDDGTVSCTRFSSIESVEVVSATSVKVTYAKLGDKDNLETQTLSCTDAEAFKKSLDEGRVLIADEDGTVDLSSETTLKAAMFTATGGIVGGSQSVQTNIQKSLDDLDEYAAAIAYSVNAIQTSSTTSTTNLVFVAGTTASDTGITAKNITINSALVDDSTLLNCGLDSTSGVSDGTRAAAMATAIKSLNINFSTVNLTSTTTRAAFLTSALISLDSNNLNLKSTSTASTTISDQYEVITNTVYSAGKEVDTNLSVAEALLTKDKNNRTSVSGVSLDEETANLVQYQHAYEANAKIVSVIDELLDVVINGLMA